MLVRAMLTDMRLVSLSGGVATLACDERIRPTAEKKLGELGQLMTSLAGGRIECRLAEAEASAPARENADDAVGAPASGEIEIEDPVIRHAIEVFKGRIVEVKPLARSGRSDGAAGGTPGGEE